MQFIVELWLPIVVSALLVWFAGFVLHTLLPHHKGEYTGLPDEAKVMGALEGVPAGQYMFPWCSSMAEMKDPAFIERQRKGPTGLLTIFSGPPNMGRNLSLTLLVQLVVGLFVAYVGFHCLAAGDPYLTKFRICGAVAFACYGLGWMPHMIWFGTKGFWANLFDGIVYSGLVAGTFGWLWPKGG